jgi:molecular chaperone GrpE
VAEGMRATLKLLLAALEKFGITQLDPLGEPFDPEWHEAMATQPSADAEPDSVLLVVQKGYRIHDRALRPARVIVARAAE